MKQELYKKCPYCKEFILAEAIKCKHCLEFIDQNKPLNNDKSVIQRREFESQKDDGIQRTKRHSIESKIEFTDDEGWTIGDTHFFGTYLLVDDYGKFDYEEIETIYFTSNVAKKSFITRRDVMFGIGFYGIDENDNKLDKIVDFTLLTRQDGFVKLRKEAFDVVISANAHIEDVTFAKRLGNYINQLKGKGYFDYMDFRFFENGQVKDKNNKVLLDLNSISLSDVSFGDYWSGMGGSEQESYVFKVNSGNPKVKFLGGFETGVSFKVMTVKDNDVFTGLMDYFIREKNYPLN